MNICFNLLNLSHLFQYFSLVLNFIYQTRKEIWNLLKLILKTK
jgi:hypothetical protein